MRKFTKVIAMILSVVMIANLCICTKEVSAMTIADQAESEIVFNEYDTFKIKYKEPTVMKVVLEKAGWFYMDINPSSIDYFEGYIFDEMGNQLSYDSSKYVNIKNITPNTFGHTDWLPAGTYYLKYWTNYGDYAGEYTYYGRFTPTDVQSLDICIEVGVRKTVQLGTVISNSNDKKVTWKSSKTKVASVSSTGKVKGLKKGTTVIKAYTDSGLLQKITVKVK